MPGYKPGAHHMVVYASAQAALQAAATAFSSNPQDKTTLGNLLDQNVIICRLRDGKKKYKGKAKVLQYLTNGPVAPTGQIPGIAGSTFNPTTYTPLGDSKVTGTAAWTDIDGSTDNPTLNYDFDFDPDNNFVITKFFAVGPSSTD
ncbi:MAG: hypothetical protein JO223_24540 [Hyphomicrobiales bacterium]|nr:hypothetical protein [Hyphomicrobiales bacterium]